MSDKLKKLLEQLERQEKESESQPEQPEQPANNNTNPKEPDFNDSGFDALNQKLQNLDKPSSGAPGRDPMDLVVDPAVLKQRAEELQRMKQAYLAGKASLKDVFKAEARNLKPVVDFVDQLGGMTGVKMLVDSLLMGDSVLETDIQEQQMRKIISLVVQQKNIMKTQLPPRDMLTLAGPVIKQQLRPQVQAGLIEQLKFSVKVAQEIPFEERHDLFERVYEVISPFISETKEEFLASKKKDYERTLTEAVNEFMKVYDNTNIVDLYDLVDDIVSEEFIDEAITVLKKTFNDMTMQEKRDLIIGGVSYLYESAKHVEKTGEPHSFKPSAEAELVVPGLRAAFTKAAAAATTTIQPQRRQNIVGMLKKLKFIK